jgi:simple sugar transport system permease protein
MDIVLLAGFFAATLRFATPLLFAALGETVSQRAGILNVGLEGIMLVGALAAVLGAIWTGTPYGGLFCAILVGALLGALHGFFSITLRTDQIVSGIALIALGIGLSGFGYRLTIGAETRPPPVPSFDSIDLGVLSDLPFLGKAFLSTHLLVYLAIGFAFFLAWVLSRTRWGLEIRAIGEAPAAADSAGVRVIGTRYACVIFGGAMSGVAGAYLATAQLSGFVENMVAGRGFIAVACVVFGRWNPLGVLLAALFFGAAEAAQIRLQSLIPGVPYQAFAMMPYALAVIFLIIFASKAQMPSGLGIPFKTGRGRAKRRQRSR